MENTFLTSMTLDHLNEEELITRTQRGDTEAFTPLFHKYQPRIYNLIYRRIRNPEAAEDLCQEVFMKAWRALPDFNRKSLFYSWLYQIAINCSIDFLRKQNREIVFASEALTVNAEEGPQITETHLSPHEMLEKEELSDIIREAVTQLTPNQHRIFNLRYRDELSIKEIATHLNKSEGTVKTHLYHAHKRLQDSLHPYVKMNGLTVP